MTAEQAVYYNRGMLGYSVSWNLVIVRFQPEETLDKIEKKLLAKVIDRSHIQV